MKARIDGIFRFVCCRIDRKFRFLDSQATPCYYISSVLCFCNKENYKADWGMCFMISLKCWKDLFPVTWE